MIKPITATQNTDVFYIVRMDDEAAYIVPLAMAGEKRTNQAMKLFDPVSITT